MRKQAISIALAVSGLIVLTGVLTDWRIASGYVMGAAISALLYWRTTMFCDQVLDQQAAGKNRSVRTFFIQLFSDGLAAVDRGAGSRGVQPFRGSRRPVFDEGCSDS